MRQYTTDELDQQIKQFVDFELPDRPTADISVALKVADFMESKEYGFQLTDMCPKCLNESMWKAAFMTSDAEFVAENGSAAVAICTAAAAALEAAEAA